jgi:hypothetical protein
MQILVPGGTLFVGDHRLACLEKALSRSWLETETLRATHGRGHLASDILTGA